MSWRRDRRNRDIVRLFRRLIFSALILFASDSCAAVVSGPYFYRSWNLYVVPVQPTDPVPRATAEKLPKYYEAFFDTQGRIVKFVRHTNGRAESETTYEYRAGGGFQERICWDGNLTVTEYDRNGKETSSHQGKADCHTDRHKIDGGSPQ